MDAIYQVRGDSAFGFSRDTRTWVAIDVTQPLKTLCSAYHLFEVGLESLGKLFTLNSQYFLADLQNRTDTLQDWLNTKAGVALPALVAGLPVLEFATSHYQSLNANIGPMAFLCPPNYHYSQDFAIEDASDVVIVNDTDELPVLQESVLYCVNGQWVPAQKDTVGVRLPGAGKIARRVGEIDIGCIVFTDIGKVNTYPIKGLSLSKLDTSLDYYSTLMLSIPESLSGKTVGYVIAGMLHWLPPAGYFSDQAIMLSLPNYSVVKDIMETRAYYDWDAIGVGDLSTPAAVAMLRNPETFKALLEHESSFIVVVDNPYLQFETVAVNAAASYGRFYLRDPNDPDGEKPLGTLYNTYGKTIHYWPTWEEGEWTLNTQEITRENQLYTHAKWQKQTLVNDALPLVAAPYRMVGVEMERITARKK